MFLLSQVSLPIALAPVHYHHQYLSGCTCSLCFCINHYREKTSCGAIKLFISMTLWLGRWKGRNFHKNFMIFLQASLTVGELMLQSNNHHVKNWQVVEILLNKCFSKNMTFAMSTLNLMIVFITPQQVPLGRLSLESWRHLQKKVKGLLVF